jgi:glycosyltransferase involved in cell wall biosynthesis
MKILIAAEERRPRTYVDYLARSLEDLGLVVRCSAREALTPDPAMDLVHLQWPEELCAWARPRASCVRRVRKALEGWRQVGTPLVATRHNNLPHHHRDTSAAALYQAVYEAADAIIHLGPSGLQEFRGRFHGHQVVIPHGNDPDAVPVPVPEARRVLGIGRDTYAVLVFGAIRHVEEQKLILDTLRLLPVADKTGIVPRWSEATRPSWRRHPLQRVRSMVIHEAGRRALRVRDGLVEEERLGLFFGASDIVFVPRIDALNSGVIPKAYSFAKPVVGPAVGNIGPLLEASENFTYPPGDPQEAARTLVEAREHDLAARGERNRSYAETHWQWSVIAEDHRALYRGVLG